MDIRCGSCSKLFRVADDKVTGKGIRFKCSRCGEIITVMRHGAASPPSPPAPQDPSPASSAAPITSADRSASDQHAIAEPPPGEFQAREYRPPLPPTAMDDFDFSEPHAVAAEGGVRHDVPAGGEAFSFDAPTEAAGRVAGADAGTSNPDEKEQQAASAFSFPADVISEPVRKPDLSSARAAPEETPVPSIEHPDEKQSAPDLTLTELETPELLEKPSDRSSGGHAIAAPDERVGPDLELSVPRTVPRQASAARSTAAWETPSTSEEKPDLAEARGAASKGIHPLAAGSVTGAIGGLGCGLPIVLLALFTFSLTARFVPFFSVFPRAHLLVVIGTGLLALGIMIGTVIAVVQAQAGKTLFFLLNILIGTAFGTFYGAGMNVVTSVASGAGLHAGGVIAGAMAGGVLALLLSIMVSIARRIMLFPREETFAAPLSGVQKAGIVLSLVVILASLYAEGTLVGKMENAGLEMERQFEATISPDGLSVQNAQGYVDEATGDLVITGAVQNGLDAPKEAWYLEVDVYDHAQKVLSTIRMLNGVQLFDERDFDILARRAGRSADELKTAMVRALQGGAIPARGSASFEMRLLSPPPGIASFYPALRKISFREAARSAGDIRP